MEAAKDADILIFVIPHQFIQRICSILQGKIKPTAVGLSLIKVHCNFLCSIFMNIVLRIRVIFLPIDLHIVHIRHILCRASTRKRVAVSNLYLTLFRNNCKSQSQSWWALTWLPKWLTRCSARLLSVRRIKIPIL